MVILHPRQTFSLSHLALEYCHPPSDRLIYSSQAMKYIWCAVPMLWLPRWVSGKESACQCRRHRFDPWVEKILWSRKWQRNSKWQPTPVFLPRTFHGRRSLAVHGVANSQTWLSNWAHTLSRHKCLCCIACVGRSPTSVLLHWFKYMQTEVQFIPEQYGLELCGSTYTGIFFSISNIITLHDLQLVESSM